MNIDALRGAIAGTVVSREDPDYPEAREALVWNARKPDRHPELIVRAASAYDVRAAIRFAREQGLKVSVRGGGHHWSGIALGSGIVLDVSALDQLEVDPRARIAHVGPGVTGRALIEALAPHGLAFPIGHSALVRLSGYLLGGGFGWNVGEWGIACFGIESLDVVTADGELRRASEAENADLFWAARGAGPAFFGVVTAFRLRLQRMPRAIMTGKWSYALEDVARVERWMSATVPTLPRNVECTVVISGAPPDGSGGASKVVTAVASVFADAAADAEHILRGIDAKAPSGALAREPCRATPFDALFENNASFFADGRYASDTFWSAAEPSAFLEKLAQRISVAPSARSLALAVMLPPPAPGVPALPDAAFSIAAPACGFCYAIWPDASDDDANLAWLRETGEAMAPIATGHYVGEANLDEPARLRGSFSAAAWKRLTALRARYDPQELFEIPDPAR